MRKIIAPKNTVIFSGEYPAGWSREKQEAAWEKMEWTIWKYRGGWSATGADIILGSGSPREIVDYFVKNSLLKHPFSFDASYYFVRLPDGSRIKREELEQFIEAGIAYADGA